MGETSAIIAADKLEKLSWDSMFNNGGTIKFVEVTAIDGNEQAEGAKEKTINITEKAEAGEVVAKSFDGGQNLSALLGTEDLNNPVI
ncbi:MAG: hypothetical protein Q4E06_01025 [Lautropia sp.]|nr:hypothetical protein [Lautropia sp.]